MVKEDKDQKLKKKEQIDKDWPPFPPKPTGEDNEIYFKTVRQLPSEGLDPKSDITDQHVSSADVMKLFGVVKPLRVTNPILPDVDRKGLHTIFWRVNGHGHIPNNEFMSWLVRGYIAEKRGLKVN